MINNKKTLGDLYKEVRASMGLTQHEFSELLGVKPQIVWRYEHNDATPRISGVRIIKKIIDENNMGLKIDDYLN